MTGDPSPRMFAATDGLATRSSDAILLVVRIVIGLLFLTNGWSKLMNMSGAAAYLTSLKVPSPGFWVWPAMLAELAIGITLILGIATAAAQLQVFAASEGEIIEVRPSRAESSERPTPQFPAMAPVKPALAERSVLLGVADPNLVAMLSEIIRAEGMRFSLFTSVDEAQTLINTDRPSLVILEHTKAVIDGIAACGAIRRIEDDETPVIVVAAQEDLEVASGVSDWLIKPDRKSTRLNSSHLGISYAVFCLK